MSSLTIKATNTNATLDNGVYSCQVTLTIFGVDEFNKTSNNSIVLLKGMHATSSSCYYNLCTVRM